VFLRLRTSPQPFVTPSKKSRGSYLTQVIDEQAMKALKAIA
jgi:hypothetical protein